MSTRPKLLVAQKVAESLFAKYMRIALATFRKFDDSFGYDVAGVKTPQSRLTAERAISNATPMIRVVSGSNVSSPRNGVIGMMPIRMPICSPCHFCKPPKEKPKPVSPISKPSRGQAEPRQGGAEPSTKSGDGSEAQAALSATTRICGSPT